MTAREEDLTLVLPDVSTALIEYAGCGSHALQITVTIGRYDVGTFTTVLHDLLASLDATT